jgi:hypothetical protein
VPPFTECGDHSLSDVLAHSTTLEVRTVPYSTTTFTVTKVDTDYFSDVAVRGPRAERVFRDVP